MTKINAKMIEFAVNHSKAVAAFFILATLSAACFLPRVELDTDRENMLKGHGNFKMCQTNAGFLPGFKARQWEHIEICAH